MERLILDLLFPRRCPLCGKISDGFCKDCAKKLPYVRQPFCFHCGKPLLTSEQEYCLACRTHKYAYTQGRALYHYADPVRESLYAIKYSNKREYLEYFADDIHQHLGSIIAQWKPQVVLPIPMHIRAKRRRGYNQAELLAKYLAKRVDLPVHMDVLKKVRKTANQKELDYRERLINLHGAFAVNTAYIEDGILPWNSVLLIDDIYTTGSTIQEAAKMLRCAGVENIYFITLCIVSEKT